MENEKNERLMSDKELEDVTGGIYLGKLSTGAQVNYSKDDPDGYQISERMHPQIRPGNN